MTSSPEKRRPVRSFVIRSGRMTDTQRRAFERNMQRWSLSLNEETDDYLQIFGNSGPVTLEIGFGMGDSLASMAQNEPEQNFVGVEVHRAGVGRLLSLIEKHAIQNIRVYCEDAVQVLRQKVGPNSLDRVNIFFPDPWHKKRHHKRRLIQAEFLTLLHSRLRCGGLLHIATDWQAYAEHVLETIDAQPGFANVAGNDIYIDSDHYGRPETKFERRGIKLGHGVWDMAFEATAIG